MKIGLKLLAALFVAFLTAGCGSSDNGNGEPDPEPQPIDGWMLSKMNGASAMSGKVYLQLNSDKTFNLYQNLDVMGFKTLKGTYTIVTANGVETLSGVYSDKKPWKNSYQVVTMVAEQNMTLKSINSEAVVYDYVSVAIPDYVKDNVTDAAAASRTEVEERFL